jgi:hypothetical protein
LGVLWMALFGYAWHHIQPSSPAVPQFTLPELALSVIAIIASLLVLAIAGASSCKKRVERTALRVYEALTKEKNTPAL